MSRRFRNFVPGHAYHLTQRGNRKMPVFADDVDRRTYLKLLAKHCAEKKIKIWAYCLMENHVHHVVVIEPEGSLSGAFQRVHGDYARYFNSRYTKVGLLWQGRFKACVLDERHLWNAVRYVERNPVRAGIVGNAEDYRWSSAVAHCGLRKDSLLSFDLPLIDAIPDWSAWLSETESEGDVTMIRERTHTGRPCATEEFARALEAQLGRPLLRRKAGRKRKTESGPPSAQEKLGFE